MKYKKGQYIRARAKFHDHMENYLKISSVEHDRLFVENITGAKYFISISYFWDIEILDIDEMQFKLLAQ